MDDCALAFFYNRRGDGDVLKFSKEKGFISSLGHVALGTGGFYYFAYCLVGKWLSSLIYGQQTFLKSIGYIYYNDSLRVDQRIYPRRQAANRRQGRGCGVKKNVLYSQYRKERRRRRKARVLK